MIELALSVVALIVLTALALVPWPLLLQGGAALAALGLVICVPSGLAYHVRLRRELERCGHLVARWWLHPTALHQHLDDPGQRAIRSMFRMGGASCGVVFLGCFVVVIGVLRSASDGIGG